MRAIKNRSVFFPSAKTALLPAAILLGLAVQNVFAAGFQLKEDDAAGLGRAYAGSTSAPDDAAVVVNNPAAMIDLKQPVLQANVTGVNFSTNFHGAGSDAFGQPLSGGNGGDGGTTKAIPAFFFAMPVNDRFALGAGVTVPFGFVTNYDPGWVGRYEALESKLESVDITVSGAFALTDQFSIGASVIGQRTTASLSQAVNFGTILAVNPALPPGTFLPQSADGYAKIHGDDWGYGWQLGFLWKPTDADRIGLNYHSKIDHTLSGDAKFGVPANVAPILAAGPGNLFTNTGASADFDTPASVEASWWHTLNEQWSFGADAGYTQWTSLKGLTVAYANPAQPTSTEVFNWSNTWFGSVGAEYHFDPAWTVRGGLAIDGSPTSADTRDPRVPDATRRWVTAGLGYKPNNNWNFDLGYAHLFVNDAHVQDVSATGDELVGYFENKGNLFAASAQYKF
ncbi:MAG TPA: outer membrane protein transport protein [Rudaea sp.]|jgi:long-chain fatty acid transport protein|nr:outer membrane protein transport protein [Rudaea sp.]